MKIQAAPDGFDIVFPPGEEVTISIPDIYTVDIETLPTPVSNVDYVTLGYENGKFTEVTDDAEGFQDFCHQLSKALSIDPPIHLRFPVTSESGIIRVYERAT